MIEIEPENYVHSLENQTNETPGVSQKTAFNSQPEITDVGIDSLLEHGSSFAENEKNMCGMGVKKALGVIAENNLETTHSIDCPQFSTELFDNNDKSCQLGSDTACPEILKVSGKTEKKEKDLAIIEVDNIDQIDKNIKESTLLETEDVINEVRDQTQASEEDDDLEDEDSEISDFPFSETELLPEENEETTQNLKTKNELTVLPIEPITFDIPEDANRVKVGIIHAIVDCMVVIKATSSGDYKVLDVDTILVTKDTLLGRIAETFGRVEAPHYVVRFNENKDVVGVAGEDVFYVEGYEKFVLTGACIGKGTDASNFYDEEIADSEIEFSDDEKEHEYKKRKKAIKNDGKEVKKNKMKKDLHRESDYAMPSENTLRSGDNPNRHRQRIENNSQSSYQSSFYPYNPSFQSQSYAPNSRGQYQSYGMRQQNISSNFQTLPYQQSPQQHQMHQFTPQQQQQMHQNMLHMMYQQQYLQMQTMYGGHASRPTVQHQGQRYNYSQNGTSEPNPGALSTRNNHQFSNGEFSTTNSYSPNA